MKNRRQIKIHLRQRKEGVARKRRRPHFVFPCCASPKHESKPPRSFSSLGGYSPRDASRSLEQICALGECPTASCQLTRNTASTFLANSLKQHEPASMQLLRLHTTSFVHRVERPHVGMARIVSRSLLKRADHTLGRTLGCGSCGVTRNGDPPRALGFPERP